MSDTINAIVTRKRGINGTLADGQVVTLPAGQFEDWRLIGWVDRATPEQVEAARAAQEKAAAEAAKKAAQKTTKSKAPKSA